MELANNHSMKTQWQTFHVQQNLKDAGFDVHWNTKKVDAMFVQSPHDDSVRKLHCSDDGLCFHDLWGDDLVLTKNAHQKLMVEQMFMSSQKENSEWHTKRQTKKARTARSLHQMMMHPSVADFKNAMKHNFAHDCPVTVKDIETAEDIFGNDVHALKGETARQAPFAVTSDCVEVPQEISQPHNDITIGMDFVFINGIVFHVTVSSETAFCTIEDVDNESMKAALDSFEAAVKLCNERELRVATALGDNKFDPLKVILEEKCDINFNPAGANEHIAETEQMI